MKAETSQADLGAWLRCIVNDEAAVVAVKESEDRIRKAYREILKGYGEDESTIVKVVEENFDERDVWVKQSNIYFVSMCMHHFLPFFGHVSVAYKPNKKIIGIGKLPRLVSFFSRRLTMQEFIVRDIGRFLYDKIEAKEVEVSSEARHLCVESRGVCAIGSTTQCLCKLP